MTRTTPELAPPLQISTPHQREDVWPLRMIKRATGPIHGGSSVESGFEPRALRPQSRDLTTRPQRPQPNDQDDSSVDTPFSNFHTTSVGELSTSTNLTLTRISYTADQ
ncbi:hypothetical protein AVEN_17317-1 [Araneus ventricosus]|uniref:Uncharacterized protein n=1 Tax=Araneus ventricosus TaxID=182803 RepID=A0A4Y2MUM3_ARAVE|nr:hypothetical protein AVEN_39171-1 [Araneus ventricosus]GBO42981.1 hypothetical protein AVEN_228691-1 [Araneus ventricosus]GBO42983.1 hypothetical protein AVEN_17317-1 [Araneus ventricosus]